MRPWFASSGPEGGAAACLSLSLSTLSRSGLRGGEMGGMGIVGGSRRSEEEEAGGIGRRQHHALVAACLVT